MRQLVHRLSNFKRFKKINKSAVLLFLILFFIFIQILIVNPTEISLDQTQLQTIEQIKNLAYAQKAQKSVEQKMSGIHLVENSNRVKGWELFAEEAAGSADSQWILKKVKIEFFSEDQTSFKVVGDLGEIDGATKNILIRGQVVTTSTNGYLFKTNDLRFESNTKSLKSDDVVEMNGPEDENGSGFQVNGIGIRIDLNKNKMTILDSVQAQKTINNKKFKITSKQAIFSNRDREGQFLGQVKMNYDEALIQAPLAVFKYSDKYSAKYSAQNSIKNSSEQKKLKTILLTGEVTLKQLDRSGTCQELEMDLELDQMTLRGSPKVQMQSDEISGQEIIFTDGGQKVKINNVKVSGTKKDTK